MILMLSARLLGQATDCRDCNLYRPYVSGDMAAWKSTMDRMNSVNSGSSDPCRIYALADAHYGYLGFLLSEGMKDEAATYADQLEQEIGKLSAFPDWRSESAALSVALLGFRMTISPARAMTLGPRALKQLNAALAADSTDSSIWLEKANSESNMPAFAGGSDRKAVTSYTKALSLMEKENGPAQCNWRYLNTMVLLGMTYERLKEYDKAVKVYRKALEKEPAFIMVRDKLLPQAEAKLKGASG